MSYVLNQLFKYRWLIVIAFLFTSRLVLLSSEAAMAAPTTSDKVTLHSVTYDGLKTIRFQYSAQAKSYADSYQLRFSMATTDSNNLVYTTLGSKEEQLTQTVTNGFYTLALANDLTIKKAKSAKGTLELVKGGNEIVSTTSLNGTGEQILGAGIKAPPASTAIPTAKPADTAALKEGAKTATAIGRTSQGLIKPEINPTLRITKVNDTYKADLVWKAVDNVTKYTIQPSTPDAIPLEINDPNDRTSLSLTEAKYHIYHLADVKSKGDLATEYTVSATLTDGTVTSGTTRHIDTVVAPTEFGLVSNIGEYASNIVSFALPIGIILAVLMTIYAGSKLMWDSADPEELKKSREIMGGAIIGIMLLMFARVLANFLALEPIGFTSEDKYTDYATNVTNTVGSQEVPNTFLENLFQRVNR